VKVHLPLMIQDPMTDPFAKDGDGKLVEGMHVQFPPDYVGDFGDGPTTSLVVVQDFDPATGAPLPGAKFVPPGRGRKMGRYLISKDDIYSPEFIQTSVLGAILKTIRLFSDGSVLGRPIEWAFDHPQLRVLPRAGVGANAFYDRDSKSLQFFYFQNPNNPAQTVYTSLSRDIVTHETGHAIIDGIAPTLYDALTPQSVAIHEAMADLTALLTAFQSNTLRRRILERTRGSIRNPTAFSSLAPEFGKALDQSGRASALRSLWNDKTLNPKDRTRDEHGRPNLVKLDDPHALSEVLSGALYRVMVRMQEYEWKSHGGEYSYSGRALVEAARQFQRLVFRAIDFLPPGDVSFADYGRALVAAERSSGTGSGTWKERDWVAEEFQQRHVIRDKDELQRRGEDWGKLKSVDPETLLKNDSEAHDLVKKHRKLLNIPPRVSVDLHPRIYTHKHQMTDGGPDQKRELLLKVSWGHTEEDFIDAKIPRARRVTCGTTLALDWDSGKVESIQTPDVVAQKPERDRMVRSMLESGLLRHPASQGSAGPLETPVRADVRDGILKITGAGRLLHFHAKAG
jgi:hypothetical protein